MCLVGGILGVYALLLRGGNFGSAQTGNLIEMLISGLEGNFINALLRLIAMVLYGASLVAAYLLVKSYKGDVRRLCIAVEVVGIAIEGMIPLSVHPIVALYPIFFVTAFQWGVFSGAKGYVSATIFSTNNMKQMLFGWTEYVRTKDQSQKDRALFYTKTLAFFHTGVIVGYVIIQLWAAQAIWICMLPLCSALGLTALERVGALARADA